MKKFIVHIVSILGLFLVVFVVLASTDRTITAALFGAGYSSSFQISKDSFSEISIVYFVVTPVVVAIIAYFVRRIIVKPN